MSDITLDEAIRLAVSAHARQIDKAGEPYILHPLRVMMKFKDYDSRIAALFHDVIEDNSDWSLQDLEDLSVPSHIVEAIDALSRRKDETYDHFIDRVCKNELAMRVKLADLEDNMDLSRLPMITQIDRDRWYKYHQAHKRIIDSL